MDVRSERSFYLLDTNMASYVVGGRSGAARARLKLELTFSQVAISSVSQAEILYGLQRKPGASRLIADVNEFFRTVPVLAWDSAAAYAYASLRSGMEASGKSLTSMDLMIGAHAMARHAVLVTKDRAFKQVNYFLETVDWADDL